LTQSFINLLFRVSISLFAAFIPVTGLAEELRIPAGVAYMLPDPESARMSESEGVKHWLDPGQSLNWYGVFQKTGELFVKLDLTLPNDIQSRFQLNIDEQSNEVTVLGSGDNKHATADFGAFQVRSLGYHRISLKSLNEKGNPIGVIKAIRLQGDPIVGAHFNLKARRNAASVHLMYPVPDGKDIEAFYCEVRAVEDPTATFYMACGWHRGYFGMQVNSPSERRIIFSVWDSGNEAIDRKNVEETNRVKLMGKGEGVFTGDFGNEGTGGHSHLKYRWKTGERQRFVVTAQPTEETFTIYSGFWFHPEQNKWMLISSWKAPKEGGWIKRPHSFSENFGGNNGHFQRKALYGNQWIRTPDGEWLELTTATFSHDPTGKEDRLDRWMGVENGQFFLSHGGFKEGFTKYGEKFTRPTVGSSPAKIELPAVTFP
jgi:Domain of unknown function (DUF3472)/Domain of unknown function (DUF5077)